MVPMLMFAIPFGLSMDDEVFVLSRTREEFIRTAHNTGSVVAVLIDATIVRVALVPSTLVLLGDRTWWMPPWLDRLLPRVDIEGGTDRPAPTGELPDTAPHGVDARFESHPASRSGSPGW